LVAKKHETRENPLQMTSVPELFRVQGRPGSPPPELLTKQNKTRSAFCL
jgi:hypothetical protein